LGYGEGWERRAGPYHFKLSHLDGASLGSQDNQIKGADIIIPPPVCLLTGPTTACQGETGLVFTNGAIYDPTITYDWELLNNTSGASFTTADGSNTITVNAGNTRPGGFTVNLNRQREHRYRLPLTSL
jgi:hypothetical protein